MSRRPAGDVIDVHVGKRARQRRVQLGLSQKTVAKGLGISFQQFQKNERGTNRIGASRMQELSGVLDVPVSFFFDGLPPQPPIKSAMAHLQKDRKSKLASPGIMGERETEELIDAYYSISDNRVRKRLIVFLRGLRRG